MHLSNFSFKSFLISFQDQSIHQFKTYQQRTSNFQTSLQGTSKSLLHPNKVKAEQTEKPITLPRSVKQVRSQGKLLPQNSRDKQANTENHNLPELPQDQCQTSKYRESQLIRNSHRTSARVGKPNL